MVDKRFRGAILRRTHNKMKILEMLLGDDWKRSGTFYQDCEIMYKGKKRILYNAQNDNLVGAYYVGSIQEVDIQRLQDDRQQKSKLEEEQSSGELTTK